MSLPFAWSVHFTARVLAGLNWLLESSISILALPVGFEPPTPLFREHIEALSQRNVLVIAPAGNRGAGRCHSPGDYEGVLSVGSVDATGRVPALSGSHNLSSGECLKPDVVAPGVDLRAPTKDGKTEKVTGTSMSCALVAGVAALLAARVPQATGDAIRSAITSGAKPVAADHRHRVRAGVIQPLAAFQVLRNNPAAVSANRLPSGRSSPFVDPRLQRQIRWQSSGNLTAIFLCHKGETFADAEKRRRHFHAALTQTGTRLSIDIPRPRHLSGGYAIISGPVRLIASLIDQPDMRIAHAVDVNLTSD